MDPLWVDKYRPRTLEKLDYHSPITQVLHQLSSTNDFPVTPLSHSTSSSTDLKEQEKKPEPMPSSAKCLESMSLSLNRRKEC